MSTQSYPWFKFAHVEYLIDPMINAMSLAAQGANTRLMAYAARQLPFGTLPNDEKTLLAMSGAKSLKQWQKLHTELMGSTWFVNDDNRWFCPLMIVDSVPVAPVAANDKADSNTTPRQQRNADRQKRYRDRNANRNGVTLESVTRNADNVTQDVTSNATVTDSNVTHRNEMGGRGEDLDSELKQDLELNQEVNTTTNVVSAPHTSEREKNKKTRVNFSANEMILSCETLSTEVANDFINYRKAKKAPLTLSAWKAMVSEIQHSGMTPDNALSETMSAGWVGVKAEWLINRNAKQSPNVIPMSSRPKLPSQMTEDERQELRRKNAAEAKKILFGDDDFIDGVASHV